jgi:hypothetical protein
MPGSGGEGCPSCLGRGWGPEPLGFRPIPDNHLQHIGMIQAIAFSEGMEQRNRFSRETETGPLFGWTTPLSSLTHRSPLTNLMPIYIHRHYETAASL